MDAQSGPDTVQGSWPPCATIASQYKYNAVWFVNQAHYSTNLGVYYYDVDAYQALGGCVTRGYQGPFSFTYNRIGKNTLWVKISSADKDIVITDITC